MTARPFRRDNRRRRSAERVAVPAAWLRATLRRGLMPFGAEAPLSPAERRRVAGLWAAGGALFTCAWVGAIALAVPALGSGRLLAVAAAVVLGGALFFGIAGYAMVGIGNALLRGRAGRQAEPHETDSTQDGGGPPA